MDVHTTIDPATLRALRAERARTFDPVSCGIVSTLISSAIFFVALFLPSPAHIPSASSTALLTAFRLLIPAAAAGELTACLALIVDRCNGRQKLYAPTCVVAWSICTLAFALATAQWYWTDVGARAQASGLALLLGHGAWAATVALLAGSPENFVVMEVAARGGPTPVVDSLDEKTPLKAVFVLPPTPA